MYNKERRYSYYINLPLDEALSIRDSLTAAIWEIASEEGVEEMLREAKFQVRPSELAIDAGAVITVVVTYLATKVVDKTTDKAIDKMGETLRHIWLNKILPKIRDRFGEDALVDEDDEDVDSETH
jgi:hypothetical protein